MHKTWKMAHVATLAWRYLWDTKVTHCLLTTWWQSGRKWEWRLQGTKSWGQTGGSALTLVSLLLRLHTRAARPLAPRQICSRNRLQKETQTNKQTTKNGFCGSYKPKQLNTSQPPTRQNELAQVRRKGSWQLALWKQQWNRKHRGAWPQFRSPSPTPSAGRGNGKFTWKLERKLVKHWNNFKGQLLFSF